MNTPIFDFVKRYSESGTERMHMPGHKGEGALGIEQLDLTEIDGADSLYEANGIIKQSENNASLLFGCGTFYSTEGSSQCIRAMLFLALLHAKEYGKKPLIAAGRNAHKAFIGAAALCGLDIEWLYGHSGSYLSCDIDTGELESILRKNGPAAVYITSPDYLGGMTDIQAIADVCHRHSTLLIVDNAHGAYLRFLPASQHPIDLGADMCCSSAHKTLPVLTGGAYLHISANMPQLYANAKNALAIFGSTSPSYLILESLDLANKYIADGYKEELADFTLKVKDLKSRLLSKGYTLYGDEPLKITVSTKAYGYEGKELAILLEKRGIVCEFADNDFIVFMLTPKSSIERLEGALFSVEKKRPINIIPPAFAKCEKVMTVREAAFSPCETVPVDESLGRVLAAATVGCPPAVPIVVSGERIDKHAIECFKYYGITKCVVIKNADA